MLRCCGKTWLRHARKSCVGAKVRNLLVWVPASILQWLHWNEVLKMTWSCKNTASGTIPIEGQHFTQIIEQDAEEGKSSTNPWIGQCLES